MPDVMADAADKGGEHVPHHGELSVPRSEPRLIASNDTDEDDELEEIVQRAIWDMSRDETDERLASAQASVFRAYMDSSIAHGFERVDARAAATLAKAEEVLAKREEPATWRGDPCRCMHGDEHHPGGGGCQYGKSAKFGGCASAARYRPFASSAAKKRGHDERVDEIIRKRQERLAARDAADVRICDAVAASIDKPKEEHVSQPSRIEEVFALIEKGEDRATAIAEELGLATVTTYLAQLHAKKRIVKHGSGPHTRWTLPGKEPAAKPAASQKKTRSAPESEPRSVKVTDVRTAPATSSARYVVNIEGLPVECSTAAEVIELARAYRKA